MYRNNSLLLEILYTLENNPLEDFEVGDIIENKRYYSKEYIRSKDTMMKVPYLTEYDKLLGLTTLEVINRAAKTTQIFIENRLMEYLEDEWKGFCKRFSTGFTGNRPNIPTMVWYMKREELLDRTKEEKLILTDKGKNLIKNSRKAGYFPPSEVELFDEFPEYLEERSREVLYEGIKNIDEAKERFALTISALSKWEGSGRGSPIVNEEIIDIVIRKLKRPLIGGGPNIFGYRTSLMDILYKDYIEYIKETGIDKLLESGLPRTMKIYIPTQDKNGKPLDTELYEKAVKETQIFLTNLNGGTSPIQPKSKSTWRSDSGYVFYEEASVVSSKTNEISLSKYEEFLKFCSYLKSELRQEKIAYEIDGTLKFYS